MIRFDSAVFGLDAWIITHVDKERPSGLDKRQPNIARIIGEGQSDNFAAR
jgi:hypothetical protein